MRHTKFPQFGLLEHESYEAGRVRAMARAIRSISGQRALSFNPRECAETLGIPVQDADLPENTSGRLHFNVNGLVIQLRAGEDPRRQRFTLAHELAHLCFLERRPALPRERRSMSDRRNVHEREEKLCNAIASELLMPERYFAASARKLPPSFEALLNLSQMFGVSITAALDRIRRLRLWSVATATWKVVDGKNLLRESSPTVNSITVAGRIKKRLDRQSVERDMRRAMERLECQLRDDLLGARALDISLAQGRYTGVSVNATTVTVRRPRGMNYILAFLVS